MEHTARIGRDDKCVQKFRE